MDFRLYPASGSSQVSGTPFAPGTRRVSFLVLDPENVLVRHDVHPGEAANFAPAGRVLCRWEQTVEELPEGGESRRAVLAGAEEVWLALAVNPAARELPAGASAATLFFLLTLLLERKRLVRRQRGDVYRHAATSTEAEVPPMPVSPEMLQQLAAQLPEMP